MMRGKILFLATGVFVFAALLTALTLRYSGISDMTGNQSIYRTDNSSGIIRDRYMAIMDIYPVPYRTHKVPTSQGETFVVESGPADSPSIVLLHGSMSNSLMWLNEVSKWNSDFHIYCIDIIGEPGLSAASRPNLDSPGYAEWLDEVLSQLNIDRASIIGTSLGGWFALDYTIRRPGKVAKLVLVSPGGVGKQKSILWWVIPLSLLGNWGKSKVRELMVGSRSGTASEAAVKLSEFFAEIPQHFRPRLEKLPIFTDEQLAGIDVPVMAVVGGKDMMLDAETIRDRLASNIAKLKLDYLPDARHFPGDRSEQIRAFLTEE
ncbi:MAG: alpha/beta hydrolase [Pseudomonadales bacterium]|nr:alpha/beta hydrolase [Pseudomonadales bacterium]